MDNLSIGYEGEWFSLGKCSLEKACEEAKNLPNKKKVYAVTVFNNTQNKYDAIIIDDSNGLMVYKFV